MTEPRRITPFFQCSDTQFKDAEVVLFGCPFDGTSSFRPGSRFAPPAVRAASYGIESFSPFFRRDMADRKFHDLGDMELAFGNKTEALDHIAQTAQMIIDNGSVPVAIGGEHLVSLPVVERIVEKHGKDVCVIQFDAHADLRKSYLDEKLSHATVMRRISEIIGMENVFQFGIRSGTSDEFALADKYGTIRPFTPDGLQGATDKIGKRPVYVTIDLDVFDPSLFPGTGTPEPGGIFWNDMLMALDHLQKCNVVGFDLVELAPDYDRSGVSTIVAAKLTRECLISLKQI